MEQNESNAKPQVDDIDALLDEITASIEENSNPICVFPLSAWSDRELRIRASWYVDFLAEHAEHAFSDICYTAGMRHSQFEYRLAVVARGREELRGALNSYLSGQISAELFENKTETLPRVVFVFPGQGSQWQKMGCSLFASEPVFRKAIEACNSAIQSEIGLSIIDGFQDSQKPRLSRIDIVQPTLFAIQVGLAKLWISWGIKPDAVMGQSMGEVAAAHIAGALSLPDAVKVICQRSKLLSNLSGVGAMAVLELPLLQAKALVYGKEKISIASINGPRSIVLSGDPGILEEIVSEQRSQGLFCRFIQVDVAAHSSQVEPLQEKLLSELEVLLPQQEKIPIYSSVDAMRKEGICFDAKYWVRNLREMVRFEGTLKAIVQDGYSIFIEVSPHPSVLPAMREILGEKGAVVASLRREQDERFSMLRALANIYTKGKLPNWEKVICQRDFRRISSLPLQHQFETMDSLQPVAFLSMESGMTEYVENKSLHNVLQVSSADEHLEIIERFLCQKVGQVAALDPDFIDREARFTELGLDSLLILELRNIVESELKIRVPVISFFDYSSVSALAEYIVQQRFDEEL
jgi:acyl transferase domain-containing protein